MKFIARIFTFLINLFANGKFKDAVYTGIDITDFVKDFLESTLAKKITEITPSDFDNKALDSLLNILPQLQELFRGLIKASDCAKSDATDFEKLLCILDTLRQLKLDGNTVLFDSLLHAIAGLLVKGQSETWSDNDINVGISNAYTERKINGRRNNRTRSAATLPQNMYFESFLALFFALHGKKIARSFWPQGTYAYVQEGSTVKGKVRNEVLNSIIKQNGKVDILPHLDYVNENGEIEVGKTLSQADMFAKDWYIVEKEK